MKESTASKELGASRIPPGEIKVAVCLLVGIQVAGWLVVPLAWDYLTAPQGPAGFILSSVWGAALCIFTFYNVYQGKNWARILWLLLWLGTFAIFTTDFAMEFIRHAPLVLYVHFVVSMALNAIVVWLLFFSEGRAWFSRRAIGARQ